MWANYIPKRQKAINGIRYLHNELFKNLYYLIKSNLPHRQSTWRHRPIKPRTFLFPGLYILFTKHLLKHFEIWVDLALSV